MILCPALYFRPLVIYEVIMNLQAAQKELRARSPEVALTLVALEVLAVVAMGWLLVGIFA